MMRHIVNTDHAANVCFEFTFISGRRRFIRAWIDYTVILTKRVARRLAYCVDGPGYESALAEFMIKTPRWLQPVLEEIRSEPSIWEKLEAYGNRLKEAFEKNPILLEPGFESIANNVVRAIATGKA